MIKILKCFGPGIVIWWFMAGSMVIANETVEIEATTIIGDKERPAIRLEIPWNKNETSVISLDARSELKGVGWSAISDDEYRVKMAENMRLYNEKLNKLKEFKKEREVK